MKKTINTRMALGVACSLGLAFGLAGTLQAAPAAHSRITLKDAAGVDIPVGSNKAYSSHQTCGVSSCHDYGQIERHSSHAQLAANAIDGWSSWNPTSKSGDIKGCNYYAKEFTQTYGHLGKWCGVSNRQQARMFKGTRGTEPANWDGAIGQFKEVRSTDEPGTGKGFQFYDYGTEANLALRTDLTVAGLLQECNECHVGGGAMEYLPAGGKQFTSALLALNSRTSLRNIATAAPGTVNGGDPILATNFTTFNYFRDTRDLDRDGNKSDMVYNDYAKTGVGEVDCLMCHLEGYNWETRRDEIVKAKHDTARAVGAGIASTNALQWAVDGAAPVGYGTTVGAYDTGKVVNNGDGVLKLATTFADNIKKTPPSANCVSCHFGTGYGIDDDHDGVADGPSKVDVKKRGDHWTDNTNWDVHSAALECMDCHNNSTNEGSRDVNGNLIYDANGLTNSTGGKTGATKSSTGFIDALNNNTGAAGPDGLDDNTAVKVDHTGPDSGKYGMCDPSHKSGSFTGVWNSKDNNIEATSCTSCHGLPDGTPGPRAAQYPLAKNPFAAHAAAGLTATNVQDHYVDGAAYSGVANATHLDIISCTACHVRKLEHYAGGALLDATGSDSLGHMGDHENKFTLRDMNDNLTVLWYKGKIMKSNVQGAYIWTDNNAATIDANKDGIEGGMDFLLPTHINQTNITNGRVAANGATSLTEVKHGIVTPDDISQRQMDIFGALNLWPQLNFMQQQFVVEHGVSRASVAWGVKGCKDCHAPYTEVAGERTAGGFYNGAYEPKAKEGSFTFNSGFVNGYGVPAAAGQLPADTSACTTPAAQDPNCYGSQPNYMQVAPFYSVNNMTGPTDFHPYLYERGTKFNDSNKLLRSLAVDVTSSYEAYGPRTLRNIERSEMLYENTFMKLKAAPVAGQFAANGFSVPGGTITGAPIYVPNAAQGDSNRGYMIVVQVKDEGAADSTAVKHVIMKPMNNDCTVLGTPPNTYCQPGTEETVAELIGQFSYMWDGDPTPASTHTTPYGFGLSDAGSGKLSITANAGKQIKVFDTIGRFGFGFAGYYVTPAGMQYDASADAIYEVNPTVATNGGGSYVTRESWVNYLNSIGTATAAPITAPAGSPATAIKNVALTFSGNTTGLNAGNKYKWDMGNGVTFEGVGPAAASISYAYPVEGTYAAKLYVTPPAGGTPASSTVTVKVGAVAAPSWTATLNQVPAPDQLELAGLPDTTTKVYVVWDDGLKTNQVIAAGTTAVNIPHTYKKVAQRWVGAPTNMFVFNTVVRAYNAAGTLIGTKSVPVSIAP